MIFIHLVILLTEVFMPEIIEKDGIQQLKEFIEDSNKNIKKYEDLKKDLTNRVKFLKSEDFKELVITPFVTKGIVDFMKKSQDIRINAEHRAHALDMAKAGALFNEWITAQEAILASCDVSISGIQEDIENAEKQILEMTTEGND